MADEINVVTSLTAEKGNLTVRRERAAQQIDMAGTRYDSGVQDIGFAAHEALVLKADFGTAGWAEFFNLDATNYVEIGRDVAAAFSPVIKLFAGEHCTLPLASNAIYAKANTGSVKLEFTILER